MRTRRLGDGTLEVPVIMMRDDEPQPQDIGVTLRGTVLAELFSDKQLSSLVVIKPELRGIDQGQEDEVIAKMGHTLNTMEFPDGRERVFLFSSGDNLFFGDPAIAPTITQFFRSNPEAACTHGSLLASSCYEKMTRLENVRVRVVDYEQQQKAGEPSITADCFGWVSTRVANLMENEGTRPFQFRMAYTQQDEAQNQSKGKKRSRNNTLTPGASFLAKGVFMPSPSLEAMGADILLDRSSIKGIAKDQLDRLLPCGDYMLSELALGNRQNAQPSPYANNWEFLCWYSPEAIQKDLGQMTYEAAQELANLQGDPLKIKAYMIEKFRDAELQNQGIFSTDDLVDYEPKDSRWISMLEADTNGHLCQSRMFADKTLEMLQDQWRDLATRGAFKFSSGMAVPVPELPPGCVCVPHLPEGDVIVTRYPIVCSDNIRVAQNVHLEDWKYYGICGIHPEDTGTFQADFDGDQFICCPAEQLPTIAKETLRLEDEQRFQPIEKLPKQSYLAAKDENGNSKYPTLTHVALEANMGKMALVAWYIGQVQDSTPARGEDPATFAVQKKELLERCFQAMQIEVDHPKSATKHTDIPELETLSSDVRAWTEEHPSPFFEVYKDPGLYRDFVMPTETKGPLYALAESVNPVWEPVRVRIPPRESVKYLASQFQGGTLDPTNRIQWAEGLRDEFNETVSNLREKYDDPRDKSQRTEAIGEVFKTLRARMDQEFPDPEERMKRASALWTVVHRPDDTSKDIRRCIKAADQMDTAMWVDDRRLPGEAYLHPRYVVSVPLGDPKGDLDRPTSCKEMLDKAGIGFHAQVCSTAPVVEFILDAPCPFERDEFGITELDNLSNKPEAERKAILDQEENPTIRNMLGKLAHVTQVKPKDFEGRVVPHADYAWVDNPGEQSRGKGSLAYSLFTDEVCRMLSEYQHDKATVIGLQYGDAQGLEKMIGQTVQFEVGRYDLPKSNPQYTRYQGQPCLMVDGQTVGTFSRESAKLPQGATFEAQIVNHTGSSMGLGIDHASIEVPVRLTDKQIEAQRREQERAARAQQKQKRSSRQRNRVVEQER